MTAMDRDPVAFRRRLAAGEKLSGTFIKLAVAMGAAAPDAPEIRAAAEQISAAARRARKPVMVFVGGNKDALAMREIGASAFIFSSDQGLMRQAAARALTEFAALA